MSVYTDGSDLLKCTASELGKELPDSNSFLQSSYRSNKFSSIDRKQGSIASENPYGKQNTNEKEQLQLDLLQNEQNSQECSDSTNRFSPKNAPNIQKFEQISSDSQKLSQYCQQDDQNTGQVNRSDQQNMTQDYGEQFEESYLHEGAEEEEFTDEYTNQQSSSQVISQNLADELRELGEDMTGVQDNFGGQIKEGENQFGQEMPIENIFLQNQFANQMHQFDQNRRYTGQTTSNLDNSLQVINQKDQLMPQREEREDIGIVTSVQDKFSGSDVKSFQFRMSQAQQMHVQNDQESEIIEINRSVATHQKREILKNIGKVDDEDDFQDGEASRQSSKEMALGSESNMNFELDRFYFDEQTSQFVQSPASQLIRNKGKFEIPGKHQRISRNKKGVVQGVDPQNSMSGFQGIHLKVDKTLENIRNSRLSVDLTANKNSLKQFHAQKETLDDIREVVVLLPNQKVDPKQKTSPSKEDPLQRGIQLAKQLLNRQKEREEQQMTNQTSFDYTKRRQTVHIEKSKAQKCLIELESQSPLELKPQSSEKSSSTSQIESSKDSSKSQDRKNIQSESSQMSPHGLDNIEVCLIDKDNEILGDPQNETNKEQSDKISQQTVEKVQSDGQKHTIEFLEKQSAQGSISSYLSREQSSFQDQSMDDKSSLSLRKNRQANDRNSVDNQIEECERDSIQLAIKQEEIEEVIRISNDYVLNLFKEIKKQRQIAQEKELEKQIALQQKNAQEIKVLKNSLSQQTQSFEHKKAITVSDRISAQSFNSQNLQQENELQKQNELCLKDKFDEQSIKKVTESFQSQINDQSQRSNLQSINKVQSDLCSQSRNSQRSLKYNDNRKSELSNYSQDQEGKGQEDYVRFIDEKLSENQKENEEDKTQESQPQSFENQEYYQSQQNVQSQEDYKSLQEIQKEENEEQYQIQQISLQQSSNYEKHHSQTGEENKLLLLQKQLDSLFEPIRQTNVTEIDTYVQETKLNEEQKRQKDITRVFEINVPNEKEEIFNRNEPEQIDQNQKKRRRQQQVRTRFASPFQNPFFKPLYSQNKLNQKQQTKNESIMHVFNKNQTQMVQNDRQNQRKKQQNQFRPQNLDIVMKKTSLMNECTFKPDISASQRKVSARESSLSTRYLQRQSELKKPLNQTNYLKDWRESSQQRAQMRLVQQNPFANRHQSNISEKPKIKSRLSSKSSYKKTNFQSKAADLRQSCQIQNLTSQKHSQSYIIQQASQMNIKKVDTIDHKVNNQSKMAEVKRQKNHENSCKSLNSGQRSMQNFLTRQQLARQIRSYRKRLDPEIHPIVTSPRSDIRNQELNSVQQVARSMKRLHSPSKNNLQTSSSIQTHLSNNIVASISDLRKTTYQNSDQSRHRNTFIQARSHSQQTLRNDSPSLCYKNLILQQNRKPSIKKMQNQRSGKIRLSRQRDMQSQRQFLYQQDSPNVKKFVSNGSISPEFSLRSSSYERSASGPKVSLKFQNQMSKIREIYKDSTKILTDQPSIFTDNYDTHGQIQVKYQNKKKQSKNIDNRSKYISQIVQEPSKKANNLSKNQTNQSRQYQNYVQQKQIKQPPQMTLIAPSTKVSCKLMINSISKEDLALKSQEKVAQKGKQNYSILGLKKKSAQLLLRHILHQDVPQISDS